MVLQDKNHILLDSVSLFYFFELNYILDICKFLDKDKLSSLLPHERAIADSLINRSKVQLQEISKITDYVHMDRRNGK